MDWHMHSRKDEYYTNKKEWLRCYFQVKSLRQDTSEDTAAMCCFVMFDSSLQKMKEEHQQAIKEKENKIQAIKYENVTLQAKKDLYQG